MSDYPNRLVIEGTLSFVDYECLYVDGIPLPDLVNNAFDATDETGYSCNFGKVRIIIERLPE